MIPKFTYDFVKEYFESFNYELVSKEYVNSQKKLIYKCPEGHIGEIRFYSFKNCNQRCGECCGLKKFSFEYVKKYFVDNGCKLLSKEYKNSQSKLDYICPEGHISKITFNVFKNTKNKCDTCRLIEKNKNKKAKKLNKQQKDKKDDDEKVDEDKKNDDVKVDEDKKNDKKVDEDKKNDDEIQPNKYHVGIPTYLDDDYNTNNITKLDIKNIDRIDTMINAILFEFIKSKNFNRTITVDNIEEDLLIKTIEKLISIFDSDSDDYHSQMKNFLIYIQDIINNKTLKKLESIDTEN